MLKEWWFFKAIFVLFSFFFVISLVSAQSFTSQGPDYDTICEGDQCQTNIYSYEKYWFNSNNEWEEIDENFFDCSDVEGTKYCTQEYYFDVAADENGVVSTFLGDDQFTVQLSNLVDAPLSFDPVIDGSVLTYEDVIPGVDLRYQYLPRKLKEEIVIKQPLDNLPGQDFNIIFDKQGGADFNIPNSIICDSDDVCQEIDHSIGEDQISITVPIDFLNNPEIEYPIYIDPTIELNDSNEIWDGFVRNISGTYTRTNNPSSTIRAQDDIYGGSMHWNISKIPDNAVVLDLNLSIFVTSITCGGCGPGTILRVRQMEKNETGYVNDNTGNRLFLDDILNGVVYDTQSIPSTFGGGQFNLSMSSNGRQDLEDSLVSDDFSFGFQSTSDEFIVKIASRSHTNAAKRAKLTVRYYESNDLTYDANGNLVEGFGKEMTYDAFNRLFQINDSTTGNVTTEYAYDHEGNRIKKIDYNVDDDSNNETTYYIDESFIQIRNTNGTIVNETYIYANGKLLSKVDNAGNKFYYHPDHLGSTTLVTNQTGDVVEEVFYLPYGGTHQSNSDERFLYTGKERDSDGFYYYGARYYDDEFRHFIQPDPIIQDVYNPQNLNRYAYVLNNPYKYVDPSGLWAIFPQGGGGYAVPGAGASVSVGPVFSYSQQGGFRATVGASVGGGLNIGAIGKVFFGGQFFPEAQQPGDIAGRSNQRGVSAAYGSGGGYSYSRGEGGIDAQGIYLNPGVGAQYYDYETNTFILPWEIQIGGEESKSKLGDNPFDIGDTIEDELLFTPQYQAQQSVDLGIPAPPQDNGIGGGGNNNQDYAGCGPNQCCDGACHG